MPKEDPLDVGLNLIKNLLALVEKNLYSEVDVKILVELNKKVMAIESLITEINSNITENLIREKGITKQDIQMIEDGLIPDVTQGEAREIAEKANELRQKLEAIKIEVEKIRGPYKKSQEKKKEEIKENKYKRLRRKEDWKQL